MTVWLVASGEEPPRFGDHPAGTIGAVVELFATEALVEVVDESGATSALLNAPFQALRVRSSEPAKRRAAG